MKKFYAVLLLFVMATMMLFISGCSGGNSEDKAKETAVETSKETAAESVPEKVFELKYSDQSPQAIFVGQVNAKAAQMIEERTNGRVKITPYFSATLMAPPDTYLGVAKGTADIARYTVGTTQGAQSLNHIFTLPFTQDAPHFVKLNRVYQELLEKFPELDEENIKQGVKWITIMSQPSTHVSTVKKPVRVPNDLKGMKITIGGNDPSLVGMLKPIGIGIVPSDITATYTNLERGLSQGMLFHLPAKDALKYNDHLKYHTLIGEGGLNSLGNGYIVNLDTWNSLPPDLQQIITEVYQWAGDELMKYNENYEKQILEKIAKEGHTIIKLTPEEREKWYELARPEIEKWITENEGKGLPARKIYDGYLELLKKYNN